MKIGLIIYGSLDTVSGGYLYDRKRVGYLRSRGDEVRVISIPPGSYFQHLWNGLGFRLPRDLDILIEDELVHPSLLAANRVHRQGNAQRRIPLVSLVHNLHSSERRPAWQNALFRWIERWHLRSVDGYIFNSTITRDTVTSLVREPKLYVLAPPGGDRLGRVDGKVISDRLAASGRLRLLFLANVTPLKGLHVVLEALRRLPSGSCSLEVVGSLSVDPAYAARMQDQARSLAAPVSFHGVLEGDPLIDLLKRSDVLVVPSFWEGFGIAYLEGMAFGLPAIGTTAGAIPQMITHGANGYLIAPGDSETLGSLIEGLASNGNLLARMSAAALQYFDSRPTWDESAELVRQFLVQMLSL